MRLREAFASALHLFVVLCFLGIACFCFLLPQRPDWRSLFIHFLQEGPAISYWVGAGITVFALLLMLGFFGIGRGRFLRLTMKPHEAIIDVKLLEMAIEECFQTHFSQHVKGSDIAIISKQRLEVAVDLLPLEESGQKKIMLDMEQKLGTLLRDRFGYSRPFTLSVHSK